MGDDFYNPMTIEGGLLYDDTYGGLLGAILDDEDSQERKRRSGNNEFDNAFDEGYDDEDDGFDDEDDFDEE